MRIRETTPADVADLMLVNRLAFGGDTVPDLAKEILADHTARPVLSLLAFDDERPIGHVLFSKARLAEPDSKHSVAILAPLAVVPDAQRQGVGGRLIETGLRQLSEAGVELVFLAGHPSYYPRHGFRPAGALGLAPPYPFPPEHADAWMVHALRPGLLGSVRGKVVCCDALNRPEHWRE